MSERPAVRFLDRTTPPHLLTLILLTALSAAALNIFLPSLPSMTAHFDTDYRLMQLSVALYLGVNAALQLVIGPVSDRFGRRPVMLAACVLFLIATLGCILAPTAGAFLVFRMMQAVIVTGLVLSRAIVRDMAGEAEAASRIGYVTMGMAVVPMVGPAIGGVLDQTLGWKANFWLLFGMGAVVTWLAWADQGETAAPRPGGFLTQLRDSPALFASPRFWGYALTAAFSSGAFFAYLGGAPYVGSEVFGLDPALLGLYFGAPALGYMVGNFVSGRYSRQLGIDRMLGLGTGLTVAGLGVSLAIALMGLKTAPLFFAFMTFVGLGNGMVLPNAIAGSLSVRPHLAGTASGIGGAIMIGGRAALSALAGALLTGASALPLQWIMFLSALAALVCVRFVIWRARRVAGREGV